MNFTHLHSFGSNNVGNYALILGVQNAIKRKYPEVNFIEEPWDNFNWLNKDSYQNLFNRVNEKCDALIIGGAMIFDGIPRYKHTGFRFNAPLEQWKTLKRPMIFYSVGYGGYTNAKYFNLNKFRDALTYIDDNPNKILMGVRNDGTKDWMEALTGRSYSNILITPDPAFYVPSSADNFHPSLAVNEFNVVLSLNSEQEVYRFGGRWPSKIWKYHPAWKIKKKNFLLALARAIIDFNKNTKVNLVLAAHEPEDFKMFSEFLSFLDSKFISYSTTVAPLGRSKESAQMLYGMYKNCNAALSMRVHSMVCAAGLGIPTLGLTSVPRMNIYMNSIGLGKYTVNVTDNLIYENILNFLNHAKNDDIAIKSNLSIIKEKMLINTDYFNDQVSRLIENYES